MDEDPFAGNAKRISKIYHEVILLKTFLQSKPKLENMKNFFYDLLYTVIEIRSEKEIAENQFVNDYNIFNDIIPNHIISIKPRETTLRWRSLRSHINPFQQFVFYK